MKRIITALFSLIAMGSATAPALAQETQPQITDGAIAQSQLTQRQVLEACVAGTAETLPNPYTDVPADHWAYEAVLTMYYCGAFRQATPPSLIERLLNEDATPSSSPVTAPDAS